MSRGKKYLNYRSFASSSRYGFLLARFLIIGVFIFEQIFLEGVPLGSSQIIIALGLAVAMFIFYIFQVLNLLNINRRGVLAGLIDLLFISIFFIFLASANPIYMIVWGLAIIRADFEWGTIGAVFTTLLAFWSRLIKEVLLEGSISLEQSQNIALELAAILALAVGIASMRNTTDKERKVLMVSMDKAQLERQRLTSLINSMNDAVVALDSEGKINMYNGSALALLDTNVDLDEKNLSDVVSFFDDQDEMVDVIQLVESSGSTIDRRDLRLKFDENDYINLRVTLSPIKLSFRSSSDRGYILTMRDITKEKSLEDERNEFISVVSHELRTPITVTEGEVSNAMFMNEKNSNDPVIQSSLESAHKQVVFLANMVNDLATLSRAERDDLEVEVESISITELMEDIKRNYEPEAQAKGLWLEIEVRGEHPELMSSVLYVKEILQNFVTNSIKYTKEGGITAVAYNKGNEVCFQVNDTGIGVSKSDQKKLFQKFFRSEDYRTRESGGTGLGLYVTQKLAAKIDAEILVESELNKGSTFSLIVPYASETITSEQE